MPTLREAWGTLRYGHEPFGLTLVLWTWTHAGLGNTELGLRALGLLIGLGVVGVWWWNARLFGHKVPLVALVLLGFNVVLISWGDNLRHYGLSILTLQLTLGRFWVAAKSPNTRNFLLAGLTAFLSVHMAYFNAFLLIGIAAGAMAVYVRRGQWRLALLPVGIGAVLGLTLVPYLPSIRHAYEDFGVTGKYPATVGALFVTFTQTMGSPHSFMTWVWLGLCGLAIVLAVFVIRRNWKSTGDASQQVDLTLFATTTMVIGAMGYFVWLMLSGILTYVWHHLASVALIAACLDVGLAQFVVSLPARRWRAGVAAALATILFALCLPLLKVRQTNMDLLAAEVTKLAVKDDLVLVNPHYFACSFHYYYRGSSPVLTVPPLEDMRWIRYDLLMKRLLMDNPVEPDLQAIAETLRRGNRVWLVGGLPFLQRGQIPRAVPPPTRSGIWIEAFYQGVWGAQTAYFVQTHALQANLVPLPRPAPISPFEDVSLIVVSGWHN